MFQQVRGDRPGANHWKSPIVERDSLREELGADAVAVAANRVQAQLLRHRHPQSRPIFGIRSTSSWRVALQRARWWSAISSAKVMRALRRNRTAPSGIRHAP